MLSNPLVIVLVFSVLGFGLGIGGRKLHLLPAHFARDRRAIRDVRRIAPAALAAVLVFSGSVQASSWIFLPSYYSHDPVTDVRIGPEQYRFDGPYYTRPQGEYVRGGYRNSDSTFGRGRGGCDQFHIFESWIQYGSQY